MARLAGLGAFAASGGLLLLLLLLLYVTRSTPGGGIDSTQAVVSWISFIGMFAALIGAHVVIGRRLLRMGRGPELP
jgi:hypothetical protein